jgi:prevent-host-death family protein
MCGWSSEAGLKHSLELARAMISQMCMRRLTKIEASEAETKFSELLERVQRRESFSICLHGKEVAHLLPAQGSSLEDVRKVIAQLKQARTVLNKQGQAKLSIKHLMNKGRP